MDDLVEAWFLDPVNQAHAVRLDALKEAHRATPEALNELASKHVTANIGDPRNK